MMNRLIIIGLTLVFAVARAQSSQKLCPDDFVFENFTTHACYKLSDELFNFDDAQKYCLEQAATMAAITSYYDMQPIANMTASLTTTSWLGTRRDANGTFVNVDNTTFYQYSNWLSGEPNADGSCVTQRGVAPIGLRAIPCYSLQPALCKKEAATCNGGSFGGLNTRSGNITSPNYPDHYYNNLDCQYLITSPVGTYITIEFAPYFVEDGLDYVTLYDGNSTDSYNMGRSLDRGSIGGTHSHSIHHINVSQVINCYENSIFSYYSKKSYESSGNQLLVRFRTDRSGTDHGWLATWAAKLNQPNVVQTGEGGNFTSPNYPNIYPSYTEQVYYIVGDIGFKINVTFTDFQTESRFDPIFIYDSYNFDATKLIANVSGFVTTPFSYVTTSNYLTMKFTSDGSMNYKGFAGSWRIF